MNDLEHETWDDLIALCVRKLGVPGSNNLYNKQVLPLVNTNSNQGPNEKLSKI